MSETKIWREYVGEELALFWDSPYGQGKEKIATFWWPVHPAEATHEVERAFEAIADRAGQTRGAPDQLELEAAAAWAKARGFTPRPPPRIPYAATPDAQAKWKPSRYVVMGPGMSGDTDSLDEALVWLRNNPDARLYERADDGRS